MFCHCLKRKAGVICHEQVATGKINTIKTKRSCHLLGAAYLCKKDTTKALGRCSRYSRTRGDAPLRLSRRMQGALGEGVPVSLRDQVPLSHSSLWESGLQAPLEREGSERWRKEVMNPVTQNNGNLQPWEPGLCPKHGIWGRLGGSIC